MRILLISPCHKKFGGWFRTYNIYSTLSFSGLTCKFIYNDRHHKGLGKFLLGLRNAFEVLKYDFIYVFEIVQPETLLPALLAKLLGKKVLVDVGDEWLDSPTYHCSNFIKKRMIRLLDTQVIKLFKDLTVTSEYLVDKYPRHRCIKVINGVNVHEFTPMPRQIARRLYDIQEDDKIILSMGNTFDGPRTTLLKEVYAEVRKLDPTIQLIWKPIPHDDLDIYIGISDLILFPTGSRPNEKACFPIRIGTYLNGERVIATDYSDTEWHNVLRPYNCTLEGDTSLLAKLIYEFFNNQYYRSILEKNVLKAKNDLTWEVQIGKLKEYLESAMVH